jgi:AmiR/NasT family two-component response regulator
MADGEREQLRNETQRLRVLIANERPDRLETVREIVEALGNDVIARSIEVRQVGEVTRRERPDVALVGLGESSEHALELIEKIVHEATCPVIALLDATDTAWVNEAAKRGIFAYITDGDADQLQSALDIVLRRFAEYHNLEGAFGRRAMIERAKGILMATHGIDEQEAFERLRSHSQHNGRKLIDIAEAVVESHRLLARNTHEPSGDARAS